MRRLALTAVAVFGFALWTEIDNPVTTCLVYVIILYFIVSAPCLNNSDNLI